MEERQVSADLTTYRLPEPFFVVATQNPHEQLGTFSLPESQLDRFLMRVTLGYPDAAHERELLRSGERRELLPHIPPALNPESIVRIQNDVRNVHVSDALLDYVQALVARTRERGDLKLGLSPRAAQGLIRSAQAWALLAERAAVMPEDVQAVLPAIVAHRLERRDPAVAATRPLAQELIETTPVRPGRRRGGPRPSACPNGLGDARARIRRRSRSTANGSTPCRRPPASASDSHCSSCWSPGCTTRTASRCSSLSCLPDSGSSRCTSAIAICSAPPSLESRRHRPVPAIPGAY